MRKTAFGLMTLFALAGCAASAIAGSISSGNLVVLRANAPGTGSLSAAATPAFLLEYSTAGSLVQTLPMPTAGAGIHRQFAIAGNATSEGFLKLAPGGQYLTLAGYDAAIGTASISTSAWNNVNRVAARVALDGTIDTSTVLNDSISGGNPRSLVMNGNDVWMTSSAGGMRHTTYGSVGSSTQLSASPANVRVANIDNGQLFTSSASSPFFGPAMIGAGLPTTGGQTTTLLPGFPTGGTPTPSSYDYWFADASTLFVADDRTIANGGGVQKWVFSGSSWSLAYTLNTGISFGCRGLTGTIVGGNPVLYATTSQTAGNSLVTVTDTGAGSAFTVLATSPAFTAFRGVAFVPEPGTLLLVCMGGLALFRRRPIA